MKILALFKIPSKGDCTRSLKKPLACQENTYLILPLLNQEQGHRGPRGSPKGREQKILCPNWKKSSQYINPGYTLSPFQNLPNLDSVSSF